MKISAKVYLQNGYGENNGGWVKNFRYFKYTITPYESDADIFNKTLQDMNNFILESFPAESGEKLIELGGDKLCG